MHTLIYLCLDVMMYVPIALVDNKLLIKQVLLLSVIIGSRETIKYLFEDLH